MMDRNSDTAVVKAVVVISVPELVPPAITVVKVSVTLVTAWSKQTAFTNCVTDSELILMMTHSRDALSSFFQSFHKI